MKCLWIARDFPFPLDAGDKIYSGLLSRALAEAGAAVTFAGFDPTGAGVPADWPVTFDAIDGQKGGRLRALLSALPYAAAIHATPAYRSYLDRMFAQDWDAIVFDSYGSGWAMAHYLRRYGQPRAGGPRLVYVSHNYETALWKGMVDHAEGSGLRKLSILQNYLKIKRLERFLITRADLVTAITPQDQETIEAITGSVNTLVLTPGYSGPVAAMRTIDQHCPKRVVILGSFRWVVKQENLRAFLKLADPVFAAHGIGFDVVGDVPDELQAELKPSLRATVFHGFVDDAAPILASARMAVVPERIGGGFKLKFLDYLFSRIPVATLSCSAAGLSAPIRDNLLCRETIEELIDAIVAGIDDVATLEKMQQNAFAAAQSAFRWEDRGAALKQAISECGVPSSDVYTAGVTPSPGRTA